jgi:hypothetical protein
MAFAGPALRRVSLETQHTFGAIGYAEEHEAPRHFKRVHLDTIALGFRRSWERVHRVTSRCSPLKGLDRGRGGAII